MIQTTKRREYILVGILLSILIAGLVDAIGIASANVIFSIIGAIMTIIAAILVIAWFVIYLHELDDRLEHVESWLEENTNGKKE